MMGLLPNATDKLSLNVPVEQLQQELKKLCGAKPMGRDNL